MRISPDDVVLAVNPGSLNEPQVWSSMKSVLWLLILLHWTHRVIVYSLNSISESNLDIQDATDGTGIFKTLRIESQQKNQIGFEIDLSLLERALKSCEPAEMASLKLSKKQSAAFLCFEIIIQVSTFELWNSSTRDKLLLEQSVPMMTIIQDVPVKVLTGDEV